MLSDETGRSETECLMSEIAGAMDFIKGCDLLDYVEDTDNDAGPDFIVQVTEKMLSAVSFIHQSGMLHRDISPDNILVKRTGEPVLIDFGSAQKASEKSSNLPSNW